jgi:5-formyltetrahydrofolate cyclo-ligase
MRPERQLDWGWDGTELVSNSYGILEPKPDSEIDISQVNALFIPAMQVGVDGSRLGRGAGYFDRALAKIPLYRDGGPQRIVVAFDHEVVDSVPHELHDAIVDMVVTPTRIITVTY